MIRITTLAIVCALSPWAMPAPTLAQSAAAGSFDGKYLSQSIKCFPAGNYTFNDKIIVNSAFTFTSNTRGRYETCNVVIKPDGSIESPKCSYGISGRISGDRLSFQWKTSEFSCDAIAIRQK